MEEKRGVVHECLSLVEKEDENIYKDHYSRMGVKIRAKIDYVINEQSLIFKSLLMNSSMKFILRLPFLVWMVKKMMEQKLILLKYLKSTVEYCLY